MDFAREIGATPVHRLPGWQWKAEKLAAIPLKVLAIASEKAKLKGVPVPDAITPGFARLFAQEVRYESLPDGPASWLPAHALSRGAFPRDEMVR